MRPRAHGAGKAARGDNRVRIIAGEWRGRKLEFPDVEGLRPTPDRVRETLFNWLGQDLAGRSCLDLFAGSGALGLEALSRHAGAVQFVERDAVACAALRANAERLDARGWQLHRGDALEFLARASARSYDVVFLDPPFGAGWVERVLPAVARVLAADAVVYLESESAVVPAGWRDLKRARAGAVHYALIRPESTATTE